MSPAKTALGFMWSRPGAAVMLLILLMPIYAPIMPQIEGWLFPVTSKIQFFEVETKGTDTLLRMSYTKIRDCELLGVTADVDGAPAAFALADPAEPPPPTVASGARLSKVWRLGATNLDNVRIRWVHRCHPFWLTVTTAFP